MTGFRFLHSSDLHLGKRFASLPEEIRGRLVEARHAALGTLAHIARAEDAPHILLAGDTFDTETPSAPVRVQALAAMAEDPDIHWWILPGNHDSLRAEPLWRAVRAEAPANVHVLTSPEPVVIAPGVALLAAPLAHRHIADDPTAQMPAAATPEGSLRIGLAHGAARSFHEEADSRVIIPTDRAETAGLAYLALGDWHGALRIGARMQYSGAPEYDGYKHAGRGGCLVVELAGEAPPIVRPVETGRFHWQVASLTLAPGLSAEEELARSLPPPAGRRDTLLRVEAAGLVHLSERGAFAAALERLAPQFGAFEADLSRLASEATAGDLDEIAPGGALRTAAEALRADAEDAAASEADRRTAARALDRLWSLLHDRQEGAGT